MRTINPSSSSVRNPARPVAKGDEVIRDYVIAILAEDFSSELPALRLVAESEKVLAELEFCRLIIGVERQRPSLTCGSFSKPVFLRKLPSDQVVDLGVCCPSLERRLPRAASSPAWSFLRCASTASIRKGPWLMRIDVENLLQDLVGFRVTLAIDQLVGY